MGLIWTVVFILLQFGTRVCSDQGVLEDQPVLLQSGAWEWNWIPLQPDASKDSGWIRTVTFQNRKVRYLTCTTGLTLTKQPNNWLRSNLLNVSNINRVGITFEYGITQPCSSGSFCTETIDLHVNQSDTYLPAHTYPNPVTNAEAYKKIGSVSRQSGGRWTETLYLPVNAEYILLAFHDEGGCKALYSVTVTYNFCAKQTLNNSLVSLPKTVAPASDSEPLRVNGSCTEKSVSLLSGSLNTQCQSNGNWNESGIGGRCVCIAGTENTGGKCQGCADGEYNIHKGGTCTLCPANSKSANDRKSCTCKKTFYRAPDESITEKCTGLPSAPRHAVVVFVNQSAVVLKWSPPENNGGRSDVYYEVECRKPCDEDDGQDCVDKPCEDKIDYIPDKKRLNATNVTATNLFSFVKYTFVIYAKNGVSAVASSEDTKFTALSVRTNGSVPEMPLVRADWLEDLSVARVSWTVKLKNGVIKEYHVTYAREDDPSDRHSDTIEDNKIDIKKLKGGKTYKFEVSAVNHIGEGPPGIATLKVPGGLSKSWPIIAAGSGSVLLVIIVAVIILIIYRRRHRRNREKDYIRALERGSEMASFDQRQYINPDNYVDLMELVAEIASELERGKVRLEEEIGRGEFADVYKGTLKTPQGFMTVAVKILRPGSNEKNQKDFLSEASIMGQFKHPNVIELIGVVTKSVPMMIITEFLESGSLEHFLKKRKDQLTSLQLLGMARGVASGMVYLSQINFIHRDIAARNILVGENMACKVTDFGLSRELAGDGPDSEYETSGGKIPVRWTAPEAMQHRIFSTASDVWSYGILLWEIMSFCDRPYWDWGNYDVINRVKSGYRLPAPKGCPKIVHHLMLDCWEADKDKRPKFAVIVTRLDELIRSPEFLKDELAHLVNAPGEVDVAELQSVEDWLKKIKMEKYSDNFRDAKVEEFDQVVKLEDNDLKEMGVRLIGHRNKLNKSIKALNSSLSNKAFVEREGEV